MQKGQSTAEAIFAAIILLVLLAVVLMMAMQKNTVAFAIGETNKDLLECERIAALITAMHTNVAKTSVGIVAQRDVQIIKKTQDSEIGRFVVVGDNFCQYFGAVANEETGVNLETGEEYEIIKENGGVKFCTESCCPLPC